MGRRLICAAILLAATFSLFVFVERYQGDNSQYLRNSDFKGGLTDWQIRGDRASVVLIDGVLRMQAATKGASPSVRQTIKRRPGEDIFRLSAWVRHDEVSGGLRAWHAMRILLASIDHSGRKLWDVPHVLEQRRGSGPWRRVVRVFYLPPQAVAVEVFAGLNMATGRMQIRDLNLEVVHERPAFRGGRLVLSAIWLFAAPWIIWPLWRQRRVAVVVVGCGILFGSLMPHAVKLELRQLFQDKAGVAAPIEGESLQAKAKPAVVAKSAAVAATIPMGEIWRGLHKLGHVVSFALLAIVAGWAWPRQLWRRTCFYLTVFAGISETLQLLTPDRSAQLFDMGLNLFGIMAGLILWHFLSRLQYFAAPDPPTA